MCSFVRIRVGGVCFKQLEQRLGKRSVGFQQRLGERSIQFGGFRF